MKCQNLLSGNIRKNICILSPAELAKRGVMVKILSGMANSVDPDQTAPAGAV